MLSMEPSGYVKAPRSILESTGEEVTAIITPVSICMALTVALVKILNPTGISSHRAVSIASIYYSEQSEDSTEDKTLGALVNAGIFVLFVTVATFVLLYLFKHRYMRFIYGYMCFTGFSIFFVMAGILSLQLLQAFGIALDAISFTIILFNFAVTGILSLFVWPAPIAVKQVYLICTAIIVAYVFTWIPEWTTWMLLAAMAVYDMFAVLMPGGPLKELVEIAEERQVDIPALVYEARPRVADHSRTVRVAADPEVGQTPDRRSAYAATVADGSCMDASEDVALIEGVQTESITTDSARLPSLNAPAGPSDHTGREAAQQQQWDGHSRRGRRDRDPEQLLPDAIRLGLGDFIFYSVLVGRAAMYDLMTAAVAYLAIVAGLGATLMLLTVHQKALPALPVSIALGIAVYFTARYALEPFALVLSTNLVYF